MDMLTELTVKSSIDPCLWFEHAVLHACCLVCSALQCPPWQHDPASTVHWRSANADWWENWIVRWENWPLQTTILQWHVCSFMEPGSSTKYTSDIIRYSRTICDSCVVTEDRYTWRQIFFKFRFIYLHHIISNVLLVLRNSFGINFRQII